MFNILYLQMYWCTQELLTSSLFGFQDIQDKRKEKRK